METFCCLLFIAGIPDILLLPNSEVATNNLEDSKIKWKNITQPIYIDDFTSVKTSFLSKLNFDTEAPTVLTNFFMTSFTSVNISWLFQPCTRLPLMKGCVGTGLVSNS